MRRIKGRTNSRTLKRKSTESAPRKVKRQSRKKIKKRLTGLRKLVEYVFTEYRRKLRSRLGRNSRMGAPLHHAMRASRALPFQRMFHQHAPFDQSSTSPERQQSGSNGIGGGPRPKSAGRRLSSAQIGILTKHLAVNSSKCVHVTLRRDSSDRLVKRLQHVEGTHGIPLKAVPERYDLRSVTFFKRGVRLRKR